MYLVPNNSKSMCKYKQIKGLVRGGGEMKDCHRIKIIGVNKHFILKKMIKKMSLHFAKLSIKNILVYSKIKIMPITTNAV